MDLSLGDKHLILRQRTSAADLEPDLELPLFKADYVDYRPIQESNAPDHVLLVSLTELLQAVSVTTDHEQVAVTFGEGALTVGGSVLSASYEGAGITLLVNPRYLLEAVQGAVGPELALEASTELRPLVLRSADRGTRVHLLMPIRPDS